MSIWSQVAGIIRIDDIRALDSEFDFDELIGKECLWNDDMSVWDDQEKHPEKYMPMGSEGSLQKSIWVNPNTSCLDAYTVSIFGSLRDHTDVDGIIEWFKKVCNKCWVRNATITIENDLVGIKNYTYNPEVDNTDVYMDFEREPYNPEIWIKGVTYE